MATVTATLVAGGLVATPLSLVPSALATPAPAPAVAPISLSGPPNSVPSPVPSTVTPAIDDGAVLAIAQVGNTMVVGGTFTTVAGVSHPYVLAFDAYTGAIATGFHPVLDGEVDTVLPGPTAGTVYLGGGFRTVNGTPASYLTLLRVGDGQAVPGFGPPSIDGYVSKVVRRGSVLLLGGVFSHVGGTAHRAFAAVDASTGAVSPFVGLQLSGDHNDSGTGVHGETGVRDMAITPDGNTMVLIGNFKYVDGALRDQIAMLDLSGATAALAGWATTDYSPLCSSNSVDAYVRGVAFSPDGSYFAVTTKGGGHPGKHCDAVSRFDTHSSDPAAHATWVDETGGDSLWGIAITDSAIFVGGHQRWMNSPLGITDARPGAVPRPGLAAVDPVSGRVLAWNPGRVPLGVAVYAFLVTAQGLWMGSDTDYVGDHQYSRPKLAMFPWSGGHQVASTTVARLPARVFLGAGSGATSTLSRVAFDGTTATWNAVDPQNIDFANWRAAFLVGSSVFYGYSDGYLYSRSFDGTTFGPPVQIDPYHDPAWKDVKTGLGDTFDGVLPHFYALVPNLSGMTYSQGRVYFTVRGDAHLYSAWFSPDSGVIDQTITTKTGSVDLSQADGLFVSGATLYYGLTDGTLHAVGFRGGNLVGASRTVSGPSVDGVNWSNNAMFLAAAAGPPNRPPRAAFTTSCNARACNFDGTASADPDGTIATYVWDFGDGSSGTGATPGHVYATANRYAVTLTVTDDAGAQARVIHAVTARNTRPPGVITFVGAADAGGGSRNDLSVPVPAGAAAGDTALLFLTAPAQAGWSAPAGVSGWQQVDSFTASNLTTTVWTDTLAAGDAGATVQLTNSSFTHSALTIAVYRGVDTAAAIVSFAHQAEPDSTRHVTPYATTVAGAWAVSYWGDRSNVATTYATPAALAVRDASPDTGAFTIQSVVADANGPVAAGQYGGLIASTDSAAGATAEWTLVLRPLG